MSCAEALSVGCGAQRRGLDGAQHIVKPGRRERPCQMESLRRIASTGAQEFELRFGFDAFATTVRFNALPSAMIADVIAASLPGSAQPAMNVLSTLSLSIGKRLR
jgi:hypothetical protein